jgi:hypothetical protein
MGVCKGTLPCRFEGCEHGMATLSEDGFHNTLAIKDVYMLYSARRTGFQLCDKLLISSLWDDTIILSECTRLLLTLTSFHFAQSTTNLLCLHSESSAMAL